MIRYSIILFSLFYAIFLGAKITEPTLPTGPEVNYNDSLKSSIRKHSFNVVICYGNKRKERGIIELNNNMISPLKKMKKQIKITEIKSIEFIRLKGIRQSKNTYLFLPYESMIALKDGKLIPCKNWYFQKKFLFIYSGNKRSIYTIFYDYRVNEKWEYSKKTDFKFPETHPNPKTVVKIVFL